MCVCLQDLAAVFSANSFGQFAKILLVQVLPMLLEWRFNSCPFALALGLELDIKITDNIWLGFEVTGSTGFRDKMLKMVVDNFNDSIGEFIGFKIPTNDEDDIKVKQACVSSSYVLH